MAENNNKKKRTFRQLERQVSIAIGINLALFLLTLVSGSIGWLKVVLGILTMAFSALGCAFLVLIGEHKRKRSLWMLTAFGCTLLCTLVSLITRFP